MRKTTAQNAILKMTQATRIGYSLKTNLTTYKYKFNNGHIEIIQVEGCKHIDPVNLFCIKVNHNKDFAIYLNKVLGG